MGLFSFFLLKIKIQCFYFYRMVCLPFGTLLETHWWMGNPGWEEKRHSSRNRVTHTPLPEQEWVDLLIGYFPKEKGMQKTSEVNAPLNKYCLSFSWDKKERWAKEVIRERQTRKMSFVRRCLPHTLHLVSRGTECLCSGWYFQRSLYITKNP